MTCCDPNAGINNGVHNLTTTADGIKPGSAIDVIKLLISVGGNLHEHWSGVVSFKFQGVGQKNGNS